MQYWDQERGLIVNKKLCAIIAGTAVVSLGMSACGSGDKKYEYDVSGRVQAQHVDYDCEDDLDADPVAFVAGKGRGGGSSGKKGSAARSVRKGSDASRPPRRSAPAASSVSKVPSAERSASKSAKPVGGVQLSKKPAKPVRVFKVSPPKYKVKPKGCETEYELFIKNDKGLFEQDVREVDYSNCLARKRDLFPECTKH